VCSHSSTITNISRRQLLYRYEVSLVYVPYCLVWMPTYCSIPPSARENDFECSAPFLAPRRPLSLCHTCSLIYQPSWLPRFDFPARMVPYRMVCILCCRPIAKGFNSLLPLGILVFSFLESIIGSRLRVEAHAIQNKDNTSCLVKQMNSAYSFKKLSVMSGDW
jgi:hypothetical protein